MVAGGRHPPGTSRRTPLLPPASQRPPMQPPTPMRPSSAEHRPKVGSFASVALIIDSPRKRINALGQSLPPNLDPDGWPLRREPDDFKAAAEPIIRRSVVTGNLDRPRPNGRLSTVSRCLLVYSGYVRRVDAWRLALLVLSSRPRRWQSRSPVLPTRTGGGPSRLARSRGGARRITDRTYLPKDCKPGPHCRTEGPRWCRRNAPPFYAQSEICTINPPSHNGRACEGDSGGPLIAPGPTGAHPSRSASRSTFMQSVPPDVRPHSPKSGI